MKPFRSYLIGFLVCLGLTFGSYYLVKTESLSATPLLISLGVLAVVQTLVQLVFFLHLTQEAKPRRNMQAFVSMLVVLVILTGGSLWIMYNLDYRLMPS